MKTFIFAYLVMSLNPKITDTCKEEYLNFILENGFSHNTYYLNVCVQDNAKKKFSVIVTSYDLFTILNKETGIGSSDYMALVKNSLKKNKPINLIKPLEEYTYLFKMDKRDKLVDSIASKGEEEFIDYFFGKRDRSKISQPKEYSLLQVIKTLFDWCVPVKFGDDGGLFYPQRNPSLCSCR